MVHGYVTTGSERIRIPDPPPGIAKCDPPPPWGESRNLTRPPPPLGQHTRNTPQTRESTRPQRATNARIHRQMGPLATPLTTPGVVPCVGPYIASTQPPGLLWGGCGHWARRLYSQGVVDWHQPSQPSWPCMAGSTAHCRSGATMCRPGGGASVSAPPDASRGAARPLSFGDGAGCPVDWGVRTV